MSGTFTNDVDLFGRPVVRRQAGKQRGLGLEFTPPSAPMPGDVRIKPELETAAVARVSNPHVAATAEAFYLALLAALKDKTSELFHNPLNWRAEATEALDRAIKGKPLFAAGPRRSASRP